MKRRAYGDWLGIGLVVLVAGVLAAELMQPGIQNFRDALMSVYRVFELDRAWGQGVLYPRMGPDLNFGLGAPLFQFYPPLAAYWGLLLHKVGFGFVAATKGVMALSLLVGGLGVYAYLRRLASGVLGAATGAVLFLLAPYVLLSTFERGAAAELLALALTPWLLWAVEGVIERGGSARVAEAPDAASGLRGRPARGVAGGPYTSGRATQEERNRRRAGAVAGVAVCTAGVMLAHNITALYVLPLALLYGAILGGVRREWGALGRLALGFGLGLALSAFYWLPALGELRYTRAEAIMLQGVTDVANGLVAAGELVQAGWAAIYSGDARFQYGRVMFVYGVIGVLGVVWLPRRQRLPGALLAAALMGTLLLQLDAAGGFWESAPLVRFVQFPWRLYGVGAFCTAVLLGLLVNRVAVGAQGARAVAQEAAGSGAGLAETPAGTPVMKPAAVWAGVLAVALVAGAAAANVPNARPQALPLWTEMREAKVGLPNLFELGRLEFPLFTDYTPAGMEIFGAEIAQPRPAELIDRVEDAPLPSIRIERVGGNGFELAVSAAEAWTLKAPRAYFPGWQVRVDGAAVDTAARGPLGQAAAEIPPGEHRVRVGFEQTPLRMAADFVALGALALLVGGLIVFSPLRRKGWWLGGTAAAGIGLLLAAQGARGAGSFTPAAHGANLGDEVTLLAYQIENPAVRAGEELGVKLYWYVQKSPGENRKVFLHLNRPDDSGRVAQVDQEPLLGYFPTTQWEGGQIFADEYRVEIPADASPGRYVLTGGMYRPDPLQNLPVAPGENVWPGDRVWLGEVEVAP